MSRDQAEKGLTLEKIQKENTLMGKILPDRILKIAKKIDEKHEKIAARAEEVSMATGVLAGVAAAGAVIAAPTGLAAVGVALGITSTPLLVTAAPVLAAIATVSGAISGSAYFYSKWRSRHKEDGKSEERSRD